jgi:hypothetical protein
VCSLLTFGGSVGESRQRSWCGGCGGYRWGSLLGWLGCVRWRSLSAVGALDSNFGAADVVTGTTFVCAETLSVEVAQSWRVWSLAASGVGAVDDLGVIATDGEVQSIGTSVGTVL